MAINLPFKPIFPDVLGAVTGGQRIAMEHMECALGLFPTQAYVNQPIEVVLVMQSIVDQPIQAKVAIRLPTTDPQGNVVVIETPKAQTSIKLQPGEVGVLRMPIVARPPTKPGKKFPVRVAVRYRVDSEARTIRPAGGGVPPSVLAISPFKLQVLQQVEYAVHKWNESTDIISVFFDIAPRRIPIPPETLKIGYETLWQQEAMAKEVQMAMLYYDEALEMARSKAYGSSYLYFFDAVEERFANRGIPLHPGEARAIAKMMAYTVDDAPGREPDVVIENTRWFRTLCQVFAANPDVQDLERGYILSHHVFEGVLHDAIVLAFRILEQRVDENLGTPAERVQYANRVLTWFSGYGDADLSYVYLPLVLSGLIMNRMVRHSSLENPWDIADELHEAYQGRARLVAGPAGTVFDMLMKLLEDYERMLTMQRVKRPGE